jgi:hypothetical protein
MRRHGDVNGSVAETAAEVVHRDCNGALEGGGAKKQCLLNAHASAKQETGLPVIWETFKIILQSHFLLKYFFI